MKRNVLIYISTAVGIALFFLVFYLFNITRVFSHMVRIGPVGVGIFLANVLLIILIGGFSWQIILRAYGHHLPFKDILIIKAIGFAISYLTPSMYIGGEPIRIYLMGKKCGVSMTRIGATVVVDKFLELGAGLFYIFLGSIYILIYYDLPPHIFIVVLVVNIILVTAATLFLVGFICKAKPFSILANGLKKVRLFKKPIEAVMPTVVRLERDISSAFGKHGKSTLKAFSLNLVSSGLVFIKPFIFFYFLHILFTLSQLALLFALTHLLLAFQFTPGALGIFELGEVGIFSIIGIQSEKALAYSLMVRIADLGVVAIAGILGVHMGVKHLWGKRKNEDLRSL